MSLSFKIYLLLLFISAILPVLLMFRLLYEKREMEQYVFSILALCISLWSTFYLLEIFIDDLTVMNIFFKLRFIGIAFLPVFWFAFSLYYTGRENWLKRKRLLLLSIFPIFTQFMIWTNQFHNLFWKSTVVESLSGISIIYGEVGPWFWIHTLYSYILILIGIILLLNFLIKIGDEYIKEAFILFVGVSVPTVGNGLYILNLGILPRAFDITPITFLVTGTIFTWAVIKLDFLKIKPVARETVFKNIDDHIFVIDKENKIVDYNESAYSLVNNYYDKLDTDIIGKNIEDMIDKKQIENMKQSNNNLFEEIELKVDGRKKYYDVKLSPIKNQRNKGIGKALILRDITLRKKVEKEAEFLHSMLRHDLGNKLQVTMGFLELVKDTDLDDGQRDYINTSLESIEEGIELIKDVRMLDKIDLEENNENIELSEIISKAESKYLKLGEKKEIDIINKIDKKIYISAGKIVKEVFNNIIENSIMHSKGNKIIIDYEEKENLIDIIIEDDGKGIPDEIKTDILEQGFKGKDSSGSGLGMYIVDKITQKYDGKLSIKESRLGGAKFVIGFNKAS